MKSALLRTGSIPVQYLNRTSSSQTGSLPSSPRISFPYGFNKIKRSNSETDLIIRSDLTGSRVSRVKSVFYPDMGVIVEEEFTGGIGIGNGKGNNYGGKGKGGNKNNNHHHHHHSNEKNPMEEYYQQLLKSNPGDSLLLRNYGKYLHEVEKNVEKAEEYYGRAILASPGDGEILSLYGSLIWETSKDEDRAQLHYDQALHASPNDSMVLGSYAHFLWEASEEEEDGEESKHEYTDAPAMVKVY